MLKKALEILNNKKKLCEFVCKVLLSKEVVIMMTMFMVVMALLLILVIIYIRKEGIDLNDIISGISSKERNLLVESFDNK
mgnify:FL=1|tara:strand:+ start:2215 stop:2454 length:240 start_codon:yes stop_codon:yes gene_type:complete